MREYHVDTHPILSKNMCKPKMCGELSVQKRDGDRPLIIVGLDGYIMLEQPSGIINKLYK